MARAFALHRLSWVQPPFTRSPALLFASLSLLPANFAGSELSSCVQGTHGPFHVILVLCVRWFNTGVLGSHGSQKGFEEAFESLAPASHLHQIHICAISSLNISICISRQLGHLFGLYNSSHYCYQNINNNLSVISSPTFRFSSCLIPMLTSFTV